MAKTTGFDVRLLRPGDDLAVWDSFVDQSPQGCVFCRSWWLDALCEGRFEVLTLWKGDELVAGMPLPRGRKLCWSTITMPPLTQTLGPLLAPEGDGKYVTQLSSQMAVLRDLVEAIPAADFFRINCHPSLTNWLPFHWEGYEQTTRYTYVIEPDTDLDTLRAGAAPQLRTKLRKAEKAGIRVELTDDVDVLLSLNEKTFAHLGTPRPYAEADVVRMVKACAAHDARTMLVASDESGRPHAVVCLVHDPKCMYNLVGGTDPDLRNSAATQLMLWHAVELAHERGMSFDFCGSMLEGVESFNRAFGGELRPYFEIHRCPSRTARLAEGLRRLVRRPRPKRGGQS